MTNPRANYIVKNILEKPLTLHNAPLGVEKIFTHLVHGFLVLPAGSYPDTKVTLYNTQGELINSYVLNRNSAPLKNVISFDNITDFECHGFLPNDHAIDTVVQFKNFDKTTTFGICRIPSDASGPSIIKVINTPWATEREMILYLEVGNNQWMVQGTPNHNGINSLFATPTDAKAEPQVTPFNLTTLNNRTKIQSLHAIPGNNGDFAVCYRVAHESNYSEESLRIGMRIIYMQAMFHFTNDRGQEEIINPKMPTMSSFFIQLFRVNNQGGITLQKSISHNPFDHIPRLHASSTTDHSVVSDEELKQAKKVSTHEVIGSSTCTTLPCGSLMMVGTYRCKTGRGSYPDRRLPIGIARLMEYSTSNNPYDVSWISKELVPTLMGVPNLVLGLANDSRSFFSSISDYEILNLTSGNSLSFSTFILNEAGHNELKPTDKLLYDNQHHTLFVMQSYGESLQIRPYRTYDQTLVNKITKVIEETTTPLPKVLLPIIHDYVGWATLFSPKNLTAARRQLQLEEAKNNPVAQSASSSTSQRR